MQNVLLIICDGFGEAPESARNAISRETMPYYFSLRETYPMTTLKASGKAVGVPEGVAGSSEPGHITIGAGSTIVQPYEAINTAISDGSFLKNQKLLRALEFAKTHTRRVHLIGIISDGGIHGHIDHIKAFVQSIKAAQITEVYIHAILDGRDVPPQSAILYIGKLQAILKEEGIGEVVDIAGRYYAMDRDTNWDRTDSYIKMLMREGISTPSDYEDTITTWYREAPATENSDYYIPPTHTQSQHGGIKKDDVVILTNFRKDRMVQLASRFANMPFYSVCTGPYSDTLPVLFPSQEYTENLGKVISDHNLSQIRIAETEKYAHVTYFFNSQQDITYPGETRVLIPSKKVASYASAPEMSTHEIGEEVKKHLIEKTRALIVTNIASPDLVGHSGDMEATKEALRIVDHELSTIIPAALDAYYAIIITGDHGNCEQMLYPDGSPCPEHTTNNVPFLLISEPIRSIKIDRHAGLKDIAPTVLNILEISKPQEMQGSSLLT